MDSHAQEAGSHHRIFPGIPRPTVFFQQRRGQFIAGDLLADELVVGLVLIEGADHVVPVAPCFAFFSVPLVAIALGKADDIQPVAPPPLSIARTGQQRLDLPRPSLRRRIAFEGRDLLGGRWQPHQIDMEPPQEFPRAGLRTQAQRSRSQTVPDKGIDGMVTGHTDDSRNRRRGQRLERPPVLCGPDRFGGQRTAKAQNQTETHLNPRGQNSPPAPQTKLSPFKRRAAWRRWIGGSHRTTVPPCRDRVKDAATAQGRRIACPVGVVLQPRGSACCPGSDFSSRLSRSAVRHEVQHRHGHATDQERGDLTRHQGDG